MVLGAGTTAAATWLVLRLLISPPRRLHRRVDPYLSPSIGTISSGQSGPLRSVFGPIIRDLANWVGSLLDRSGDGVTLTRLRQAGWYTGMGEERMVQTYRVTQLRTLAMGVVLAMVVGQILELSLALRALLLVMGGVVGATRTKGRLDKAINRRKERMRIEIYTVNQLLAMRVRTGGGVVQAVNGVVQRGSGEVVAELSEALRLHRSGWRGPDAFRRIAELTPEPFCSRTYRLLAVAEERGSDLAGALLSLSEDVRETRRESIKRAATKRRAAMLIPTIAILAPVLILFVAAPLPYLITGWQ